MKKIYLIALICAIAAGAAVYLFANQLVESNDPDKNNVMIVEAISDVPAGTQVTTANLDTLFTIASVDVSAVTEGCVQDPQLLVGQTTSGYIYAGEIVNSKRFGDGTIKEENAGLSYNLEDGYVAYSIPAGDTVGVSGFILPGDTVNILNNTVDAQGKPRVETFLEDVKVLKISSNDVNANTGSAILTYSSIVVEVTESDAKKLFELESGGQYKLILNRRAEENVTQAEGK